MAEKPSIWERMIGKTKQAQQKLITRALDQTVKAIDRIENMILKANDKWTKGYHRFLKAVQNHANLKIRGTKKEAHLQSIIDEWLTSTEEQTIDKKNLRAQKDELKNEKQQLELALQKIKAEIDADKKADAEIVEQVFALQTTVLESILARNNYLNAKVYNRLIDDNGNLRSQITIDHPDATKRVVALVNSITKILPELAQEAKNLIDKFFERFQQRDSMSAEAQALYDLTRQLLVEKTSFRVGPELYRFLDLNINEEDFPELYKAQSLLRRSLRSEKTESYIRLYTRKNSSDKWTLLTIK